MTDPMSPAPSAIRANPMGIEEVKAPEVVYEPYVFERHELIAMGICLAIGGLFAVGVYFLPTIANFLVNRSL